MDHIVKKKNNLMEIESALNSGLAVFPGFCDVHVHFREPGFSYKETIASGSRSALRGGYTDVMTMPNLKPVPDSISHLNEQLRIIEKDNLVNIYPYASITVGEEGKILSDMDELSEIVHAFSDDGKGLQDEQMMRCAMIKAKELGSIIAAHCEDNSLLNGGYIHDGRYAESHGHKGISSESEWRQIERDIRLAGETGCKYHVCHISTAESIDLIRRAKKENVDITCETAPHYLVLSEDDIQEDGRFKMNPPLRSDEDRQALIEGIQDGTIDMIATDHAPHSMEEKSRGLRDSAFGITGLECAFPVLYTELVRKNVISLDKLISLMSLNPRKRFNITSQDCFCVWDLNEKYVIDPREFASMGKCTPFEGREVYGRCKKVIVNGQVAYEQ